MANTTTRDERFVADVMLGGLAQYLLLAGFDCDYFRKIDDTPLINHAIDEDRILLSRDRELIERMDGSDRTLLIESTDPEQQFMSVVHTYDLKITPETIFSRCSKCNVPLEDVDKDAVLDQIPEETRKWIDHYKRCPNCEQIYWEGSHYEEIVAKFKNWDILARP